MGDLIRDLGEITGITSLITLIEVITRPLKEMNYKLEDKYRDYLLHSNNLVLGGIDVAIAEKW